MDQRSYPKCVYCEEYENFLHDYICSRLSKQTAGKGYFTLPNYIVEQLRVHIYTHMTEVRISLVSNKHFDILYVQLEH
jgi:hypothetical protein